VKLNLGCGNMPLKGWKNIDKFYYPGTAELHPDHGKPEDYDWEQGDFTTCLKDYKDNSVDKVMMVHSLEHTYWEGAIHTLEEIYRILKQGGTLEVEVPDLDKIYYGNFSVREIQELIYGGLDDNTILLGHHCGFNKRMLTEILNKIGFKVEEIEVGYGSSKPEPDRNFRLKGVK